MTTAPLNKKAEKERGFKEGFELFDLLRAKWPAAFPRKSYEIRPLANSVAQALIEEFGWSPSYAHGVLAAWKMRHAYCQAILRYTIRINIDGSTSDEEIGDMARQAAQTQLERRATRQAKKAEKAERLRTAAEMNAAPNNMPTPEPSPIVIPDESPTPTAPPKSGKLLVAGSAAMQAALKRRLAGGAMTTEILKTVPATRNRRREQQSR